MTNFDYLLKEPSFQNFAKPAIAAEKIFSVDPNSSLINIRKAAEQALGTIYEIEQLQPPFSKSGKNSSFADYLNDWQLPDVIPPRLIQELNIVRVLGNKAAHSSQEQDKKRVIEAFKILFELLDWMAYTYGPIPSGVYQEGREYDLNLLKKQTPDSSANTEEIKDLLEEIERLRKKLQAEKDKGKKRDKYQFKPMEDDTRRLFIDIMLENAGWKRGTDWVDEYKVSGLPTPSGKGAVDYVLFGDDGKPLALIEAKKTSVGVEKGRQQAACYADALKKEFGRRPMIFLSNGIETRIIDGEYPERKIADFYSKRDLEKRRNLRMLKSPLMPSHPDESIAGRYYQQAAIRAICEHFDKKYRKALLVMATGAGKTRTAVALIDWLIRKNWVTNVLFLADRNMLVSQAKDAIVNNLPNVYVTDLSKSKDNYDARVVVSTYQTMVNCIDSVKDKDGRLYTPGHFDLIVCDEVHRSIYNKYSDIFLYFDAPIIGLTATPKDEVDRNTYRLFELQSGDPTYVYDLEQGVKDGYLIPYELINTGTKFIKEGITYDELSKEEKEDYENQFENEEGALPDHISQSEINKTLFNRDTVRLVLGILMESGLKVDYGQKLGKTIIFAQNHRHAEFILDVFHSEYPYLPNDFIQVIDYQSTYNAEDLKKKFENENSYPQIAVSVDMLDTGVDIPSILNLVFFKRLRSKTKFMQMIGRGTRTCPGLVDGKDKEKFLIFDFLGNFDYFLGSAKVTEPSASMPIQGSIFLTIFEMIYLLQKEKYFSEKYQNYRSKLTESLAEQVRKLNTQSFNVHQHLKTVLKYDHEEGYDNLDLNDLKTVKKELTHLIDPLQGEISAIRFDALMYRMELELLKDHPSLAVLKDLKYKANELKKLVLKVPEVNVQEALILKCLDDEYLKTLDLWQMEETRMQLRDLMKFIPKTKVRVYETDYQDELSDLKFQDPKVKSMDLRTYKEKAESYIRNHENMDSIRKLKNNEPLNSRDIQELEQILWGEVGTKADYEAELHDRPLGEFVRSITGLDRMAAKNAFAQYINEAELDSDQIYFVNQIIDYLALNGTLADKQVLMESPFDTLGGPLLFQNDLGKWQKIMEAIDNINSNADVLAA